MYLFNIILACSSNTKIAFKIFFSFLQLYNIIQSTSIQFNQIQWQTAFLREFNHDAVLYQQFGQNTSLISEISAYFRDPKIATKSNHECLLYLDKFPLMKEIFLKFNCIFQTEADVERIFSYAGRLHSFIILCRPNLCSYYVLILFSLVVV